MGDFDEVERLQAGIRGWLLRSARGGRHELRGMDAPDGGTLAAAGASDGSSGKARRWDVAFPAGLLAAACTLAGQSLTREQWAGYAGTQPFQQVCPAS